MSGSEQRTTGVDSDGVVFASQIDDHGRTVTFEYGEDTSRTLRRILQAGLASDQALDHTNRDRRDKVRALSNALGYSLDEIDTESTGTKADDSRDAGILEAEWPYEYVEPGEVERNLSYQQAKELRQELEALRSTVDEWACDECEERQSVCWQPATDTYRCRVCAGFEDPHHDHEPKPEPDSELEADQ